MPWPLAYILHCEALHVLWGWRWLLPPALFFLTLTTFSRHFTGRGAMATRPSLWLWAAVFFCLAWALHIGADRLNLGF